MLRVGTASAILALSVGLGGCGSSEVDAIVRTETITVEPEPTATATATATAPPAQPSIEAGAPQEVDAGTIEPMPEAGLSEQPEEILCNPAGAVDLVNFYRFRLEADQRCMVLGEQVMGGTLPLYLAELSDACDDVVASWLLERIPDGAFEIEAATQALNLDIEMASVDIGAPAVVVLPVGYPSQRWSVLPRQDDLVALRPLHTTAEMNRCLGAAPDGGLQLEACSPGDARQEWVIEKGPCVEPMPAAPAPTPQPPQP
jgi:hypothetical protein